MNTPLWCPDPQQVQKTQLSCFTGLMREKYRLHDDHYHTLHQWSIEHPDLFWKEVWYDSKIIASVSYDQVMGPSKFPRTRWFEGARLNLAENLLERGNSDDEAIRFVGESGKRSSWTRAELKEAVARCAEGLKAEGIGIGDRVAAVITNCPEAVIGVLATASLGALWSSCSPDFGASAIYDRLGQIEPKVLITVNAYLYNGKEHDCLPKIREVSKQIPSISLTYVIPFTQTPVELYNGEQEWYKLLENHHADLQFESLPFDHPVYIMYSSGTTGLPKSIVHGGGGTLLKHLSEHRYHGDLRSCDRLFFFTTCGWMMWNWMISGLACGACIVLYDGAPTYPNLGRMWRLIDEEGITHFGTSPKFLSTIQKTRYVPKKHHRLNSLKAILSTGSPLPENLFEWSYEYVHPDIPLMSISGGTDLIGCFMLGNPNLPVYSGQIQCKALGMDTQVFDPKGKSIIDEKGELVCCSPFPSMPVGFWNDLDDRKFFKTYFERFPNVWTHGDIVEITGHGGLIVYGRSDTVLNPGGVRIGTSEIYRPVEALPEVLDSLVVGQPWQNDVRVVLFVVLMEGIQLDEALISKLKTEIRTYATPRHIPSHILEIPEVPRTISGKKVELAVLKILKGEKVDNITALANPGSLEIFKSLIIRLSE